MRPQLRRWLSWKRAGVLVLELLAIGSHYLHHNGWITSGIVVVSIGSVVWKALRDHEEHHWSHHGGYEIRKSTTMFTFCDAVGHLVLGRKTQVLRAYQRNITSIDDGNIGCSGSVGDIRLSKSGKVGKPAMDGIHRRYTTDLGEALPFRKDYERWIEVEYLDSYLDNPETAVVNVPYGTRRVEVVLRFDRGRIPKQIQLRDRGLRGNENLDHLLQDKHGDRTEYVFGVDRPEYGSKYVFTIEW